MRSLLFAVCLVGCLAAGCSAGSSGPSVAPNPTIPDNESLLFVVRGNATAAAGHFAVNAPAVEWFSDRPLRQAGFTTDETLVGLWQGSFGVDPPSAALAGNGIDAVLALDTAQAANGQLDFTYHPIRSTVPEGDLGAVSVFIDSTTSTGGCDNVTMTFGANRVAIITAPPAAFNNDLTFAIDWHYDENLPANNDTLVFAPVITQESRFTYSAGSWQPEISGIGSVPCTRSWSLDCTSSICVDQSSTADLFDRRNAAV